MIEYLDYIAVAFVIFVIWSFFTMSAALARLQAEVAENTAVTASAIALIEGLAEQIRENAEDPAALNALADQLDTDANKLSAAVVTNTSAPEAADIPAEDLEPIVADDTGGAAGEGDQS